MKTCNVALINNHFYCQYSGEITTIDEFIQFLNDHYHSFVKLEGLIEKGCVAPFFIEEDLKTETRYWNPSQIRFINECEISVLRRFEYEERLQKVIEENCIHCVHYSENGCENDSNAFIEKIDLNGFCYDFEKAVL